MVTRPLWLAGAALVAALAFAGSGPAMGVEPCKGAQLAGTFKVIPPTGSEFYFPDVGGRGAGSLFEVTP